MPGIIIYSISINVKFVSAGIEIPEDTLKKFNDNLGFSKWDHMSAKCREKVEQGVGDCAMGWAKQFRFSEDNSDTNNNCKAYWDLWCKSCISISVTNSFQNKSSKTQPLYEQNIFRLRLDFSRLRLIS